MNGYMKRFFAAIMCACIAVSVFMFSANADETANAQTDSDETVMTKADENAEDSLFSVNASEAFTRIEGDASFSVNTEAEEEGKRALEITNDYGAAEFTRTAVDLSGYDFPKDILLDAKYASVKYKYMPPEGTVVKKGKMILVMVVGRDKDVVSYAIKSEEAMVSGGWTTAVFNLEKFSTHRSGKIEQMYIYPFGFYDVKLMTGLSEKMYIGDICFHEKAPNVEEVIEEDTSNKVVVGQKAKSGFSKVTKDLFSGLGVTLMLFACTLLFSLPIGLIISLGAICRFKIIKLPLKVFVWVIRGTPLMLQLMLFYYGPGLLGYTALNKFVAALLAFVINYACYFSEIFRGGIESIPKGQYEAGRVLGLTRIQVFFKIVLMQVVKNILPPMSNEFLTLVKDTALANTITVVEITWIAKRFTSEGLLWPLFYSGIFYLAVCGILTVIFNRIEKKLDYYKV